MTILGQRKVDGAENLPRYMLPFLGRPSPTADCRPLFFRSCGSAGELPASFTLAFMRTVRVRPAALLKQWVYDNYKASKKAISRRS